MVFNDVHLYAVIFSVVVINYTFQDGKSDYFQGGYKYQYFNFWIWIDLSQNGPDKDLQHIKVTQA